MANDENRSEGAPMADPLPTLEIVTRHMLEVGGPLCHRR